MLINIYHFARNVSPSSKETRGVIFDIKRFAIHDGPGIRTTVFFKGCFLQCWWCHNPESRNFGVQRLVTDTRIEEIGRQVSVAELMDEVRRDIIFYDESGGGITISGGEPLAQLDFLKIFLQACKHEDLHVALDTTGYIEPEALVDISPLVDLFLYDLKMVDEEKHEKYTGVSNKRILENLAKLSELDKTIYIRIPVIPGINDDDPEIAKIAQFISNLSNIGRLDLLPYHKIAEHKYHRLGLIYRMTGVEEPDDDYMRDLKARFDKEFEGKIEISIGG